MSIETVIPSSNGTLKIHNNNNNKFQEEDVLLNIGEQECDLFIKLRSGIAPHILADASQRSDLNKSSDPNTIVAREIQKQLLKSEEETLSLENAYVMTYSLPAKGDPTKKQGRGLVVRKQYVGGDPKGEFFLLINSWDKDTVLELNMIQAILEHVAVGLFPIKSLKKLAIDK